MAYQSFMMFGASAGKMHALGLVSTGASFLTCLAGAWLGRGPQTGYGPGQIHVASQDDPLVG